VKTTVFLDHGFVRCRAQKSGFDPKVNPDPNGRAVTSGHGAAGWLQLIDIAIMPDKSKRRLSRYCPLRHFGMKGLLRTVLVTALMHAGLHAQDSSASKQGKSEMWSSGIPHRTEPVSFVHVTNQLFMPGTDDMIGYVWGCGMQQYVMRWSTTTGEGDSLACMRRPDEHVLALAVDTARQRLIYSLGRNDDRWLVCRDIRNGRVLWEENLPEGTGEFIWSIRSAGIIGALGPKKLCLINVMSGQVLVENDSLLEDYRTNSIRTLCAISGASGNRIAFWNSNGGRGDGMLAWLFPPSKPNKWITVWDVKGKRALALIPNPGPQGGGIAFTSDERRLAVMESPKALKIFPIADGDSVQTLDCRCGGSAGYPLGLVVTSDSTLLISDWEEGAEEAYLDIFSYPGLVLLKKVQVEMGTMHPHSPQVALSPQGDKISIQVGSRIYVYSINPWKELISFDPCQKGPQTGQ